MIMICVRDLMSVCNNCQEELLEQEMKQGSYSGLKAVNISQMLLSYKLKD
jgi:hypothetical protein